MAMASINQMIKRQAFSTVYAAQKDNSETIVNTFIFEGNVTIEIETPYGELIEVSFPLDEATDLRDSLNTLIVILEAKE